MPGTLVVVESPTKAKTLEKYLGAGFIVRASYGHIRDLPKSKLGVDTEGSFEPEYVVPEASERAVRELRAALKKTGDVILATDYDREGEAIAFHVAEILKVDPATAKRVTFTEITKDAILEAFRNPRAIDLRLVEAQQARRILDRLVGYRLSPVLWKKVRPGLSAGRVQSVAVRLIVEREREIRAFIPIEYWSVDVRLTPSDREAPFTARLTDIPSGRLAGSPDKKGIQLSAEADAASHVDRLGRADYRVEKVEQKERKRSPAAPFTTSTLQQEAARKLGFSARTTMRTAQQLYEGISVPGEGAVGLITYMRTDSVTIAESALAEIAGLVRADYGEAYSLSEPRRYKTRSRNAQEAHEAVRPTSALRRPDAIRGSLDDRQYKLYRLIWQRTVASQMTEARFNQVGVDISAASDGETYGLRATGQTLLFDGFRRVYFEGRDDAPDEDAEAMLPELTAAQLLKMLEVLPEQHFTQPPPRYGEASLVKTLEELGIGRPSTYASIISTIQDRGYVRLEDKRFYPEDVAEVVTDLLVEFFPDIVDTAFTAKFEGELDDIAEGKLGWIQVLDEFYGPFERTIEKSTDEIQRFEERLDEHCTKCPTEGREPGNLIIKLGKYGKFIGCDNFPECTYIRNMDGSERPEPELIDELCPECGRQLQRRVGRFGPFTGCSGYPECRFIKRDPPKSTGVTCPECKEGELVEKRTKFGMFYGCSRYPDCSLGVNNPPIADHPCPECGSLLLQRPTKGPRCWNCGAETDENFVVTKSGDTEAEAAVRAAKAEARVARAAAKAAKAKSKAPAKKKKKTTTKKKKAPAKKKVTTAKNATDAKEPATVAAADAAAAAAEPVVDLLEPPEA